MWTSRVIWRSRLRWSEFPITTSLQSVVLSFDAELLTRQLSLNTLSSEQEDRHALMKSLHESGLNSAQIADELNARGILTPKGLRYYPELVFVTRRKFENRFERSVHAGVVVSRIAFSIEKRYPKEPNR